jgi:hypothetical protein
LLRLTGLWVTVFLSRRYSNSDDSAQQMPDQGRFIHGTSDRPAGNDMSVGNFPKSSARSIRMNFMKSSRAVL